MLLLQLWVSGAESMESFVAHILISADLGHQESESYAVRLN